MSYLYRHSFENAEQSGEIEAYRESQKENIRCKNAIEKAIADTKETYYEVLQNADQNWYEGENDPKPFIKYMLGIILSCYREFEARIVLAEKTGKKSKAYDVVKTYSENTLGKFSKHDALVACPSLGSSSVESALKKLVDEGAIIRTGAGRKTMYMKKRE